jgi:hypothetical protein
MPGDLYMGEVAANCVEEFETNEVSLVEHPRDKRCLVPIEYDHKHLKKVNFIHYLKSHQKLKSR